MDAFYCIVSSFTPKCVKQLYPGVKLSKTCRAIHSILPRNDPLQWIWAPNDQARRRVVIRPVVMPILKIAYKLTSVSSSYWWYLSLPLFTNIFVFVCLRYTHTAKTSYEMQLIAEAATFRTRVFMPLSVLSRFPSAPPMKKILSWFCIFQRNCGREKKNFVSVKRQRQ